MTADKLCLDCGRQIQTKSNYGARCLPCRRLNEKVRNSRPHRRAYDDPAYKAIPLVGPCRCCGSHRDLTRHHVVPLVEGPRDHYVVIMCRRCNSSIATGDRCRLGGEHGWVRDAA